MTLLERSRAETDSRNKRPQSESSRRLVSNDGVSSAALEHTQSMIGLTSRGRK